jgi:microcystin-dependent protein
VQPVWLAIPTPQQSTALSGREVLHFMFGAFDAKTDWVITRKRLHSKRLSRRLAGTAGSSLAPFNATASTDPYLGEINWVAFNLRPRTALCNGQILPINQNQALFSLLGTTYGGNGQTTFALPDMRGRAPIHVGQGHVLGESSGSESVTLLSTQLPSHTHLVNVDAKEATVATPGNTTVPAKTSAGTSAYAATTTTSLAPAAVTSQGGNQPHNNMKPYIAMTCIISLVGVFPTRN